MCLDVSKWSQIAEKWALDSKGMSSSAKYAQMLSAQMVDQWVGRKTNSDGKQINSDGRKMSYVGCM